MDPSTDPSLEIVSAFVDGEDVPPAALAAALAAPGARELLRDAFLLRAAVRDEARPSDAFYSRMKRTLAGAGRESWWRRTVPLPLPALAAGLLLAAVLVGLWLERARPQDVSPPPVSRLMPFEAGVDWKPIQGERP